MGEIKIHRTAIADPEANVYYFITDDIYKRIKAGPLMKYVVFERGPGYLKGHTIDYGSDIIKINGHKFCINNFKVEDTVDERIFDEGEDEDMKRMEHGVYFDEKDKYHNFKFYVWNDAKRSKHDNKFSKYFAEYDSYFYKYDAEIGELATYRPDLAPFNDWIEVSKEDCLDYENCCERIIADNFSPVRTDIYEIKYYIIAERIYDDRTVVAAEGDNGDFEWLSADWIEVKEDSPVKDSLLYFPSRKGAEEFIKALKSVPAYKVVNNIRIYASKNDCCTEDESYELEDGKKLKNSLKEKDTELLCYREKRDSDFIWIFDKRNNKWFVYDTLTCNLKIATLDCVPAADKLQEIGISKSDAENVKEEIERLLNSKKSSVVAITKDFKRSASKSKEKKNMTATMKKVKVVPKSEKYTRNDIEQALNEAYDDYGYVLDFIKEDENYVYIYLKENNI